MTWLWQPLLPGAAQLQAGGSASGAGASDGVATAAAVGASQATASSSVAGAATAAATGSSTAASVGNAAGTATADATGTFTGIAEAVGTAAGTSTASAVGFYLGGIEVGGNLPTGGGRITRLGGQRRKTLPYGWWAEVERPAEEIAQAEAAIAEARAEVKASGEVQPGTLRQLDTALWFADVETKLNALEAAETKRKAQAELNAIAAELAEAKAEYQRMLDEQDEEEAIALLFTNTI